MKTVIRIILAIALPSVATLALAGNLTPPAGGPSAGSGMPTTKAIFQQLSSGQVLSAPGVFQGPTAGPGASGRSLKEIAGKLPAPDNANGAALGEVLSGKTFWGLRTDGTWGPQTGTAAAGGNVTGANGSLGITIPDGLYSGSKTATATDGNLAAGNIKSGTAIFGVSGTVIQATGDATAGNVLSGMTFSNSGGAGISGTMPNRGAVTITPGTSAQTIPAGYHNGSGTVTGDANLVTGNIKAGATIFGVSGKPSVVDTASGTATAGDILSGKIAFVNGATVTGTRPAYIRAVPVTSTGISTWSDATANSLTATQAAFPRQDADSRKGGFLYTMLDAATGATLEDIAASWGCVRDGVTGLTWENKTTDSGLHNTTWTYSWYNSDSATNGGSPGTASGGACGGTVAAGCDTEKFVAAVNTAGWCGFTDWRMPTVDELRSIVNLGRINPAISTTWFPNTQSSNFWSGSPYAGNSDYAWYVSFYNGYDDCGSKGNNYYVRLVRGGQ